MSPRFVQIHTLTSYPASLLNRDDVGFAKRIPFGGATRTRVSSQCLKRHWRTFDGSGSLGSLNVPLSVRSRLTFEKLIVQPLVESKVDEALARAVTEQLMVLVLGQSEKAKKAKAEGETDKGKKKGKKDAAPAAEVEESKESLQTGQITVLGRPEIDFLLVEAKAICATKPDVGKAADVVTKHFDREKQKNLAALRLGAGLDAALFGRMVTSDILARCDAALHVAHAFTVHEESSESDYFSAIDDLLRTGDDTQQGSGHIGSAELTTGLYYGYIVVDVPLLVSNLTGVSQKDWQTADRTLAADVVECLVQLVATVSPGAKLGSTAPHAYAHLVLAETGDTQPRTLANAFLDPVRSARSVVRGTYEALGAHLGDLDSMYGVSTERKFAAIGPRDVLTTSSGTALTIKDSLNLPGLAAWIKERVRA